MKRSRVRSQPASPKTPRDRREVTDIITTAILSKPRMALNEKGRNQIEPLGAKSRREVASLLRKAHYLLGQWWKDENSVHVTDAATLVKEAVQRLEPS